MWTTFPVQHKRHIGDAGKTCILKEEKYLYMRKTAQICG